MLTFNKICIFPMKYHRTAEWFRLYSWSLYFKKWKYSDVNIALKYIYYIQNSIYKSTQARITSFIIHFYEKTKFVIFISLRQRNTFYDQIFCSVINADTAILSFILASFELQDIFCIVQDKMPFELELDNLFNPYYFILNQFFQTRIKIKLTINYA